MNIEQNFGITHLATTMIALCLVAIATPAIAQPFPARAIHIIVPTGPGGVTDVLTRTLGQKMSESTGQPVIVENRAGAGGVIAAESVMKAAPDGYTILVADTSHYAIIPALYAKVPYDVFRDFSPIIHAANPPIFLVASAATRITSVDDLVRLGKTPAGVVYGSPGNGGGAHLATELLKTMTGTNLVHVPFKGVSTLVPALLSGDVAIGFTGLPSVQQYARAGKLRILAIATAKRSSLAPEVPTIAESGVPGYAVNISMGLLAPAATPRAVVTRLNEELGRALKLPDVRQRFEASGIEPAGSTPEQFADLIRGEMQEFRALVKATGIKID
ncbi:MAG: tripartite tricarboxylate transporter substrate binding protein [Betaproteobacteria bacterium]|nr:tripartite tricarboxylate transporter substrate binding protein [Betaproteobacteria bacterium]